MQRFTFFFCHHVFYQLQALMGRQEELNLKRRETEKKLLQAQARDNKGKSYVCVTDRDGSFHHQLYHPILVMYLFRCEGASQIQSDTIRSNTSDFPGLWPFIILKTLPFHVCLVSKRPCQLPVYISEGPQDRASDNFMCCHT